MTASRKRQLGIAAVLLVAMIGAGAALAASKLRGHGARPTSGVRGTGVLGDGGNGRPGFGPRMPRGWGGHGRPEHGPRDDLQIASGYLGISGRTLLSDLRGGKTLAQIANATNGKSARGLIDALVSHEQGELDAAVKAGRITKAEADSIGSSLKQRVTARVNGTLPQGQGGFRGNGFRGHGGFETPPRAGRPAPQPL
jgi:hypothetical protein